MEEMKCNCTETCDCGCQEGKDCTCHDCGCLEGEKCTCGEHCDCHEHECNCGDECNCDEHECRCEHDEEEHPKFFDKKKYKEDKKKHKEEKNKYKEKIEELEKQNKKLEQDVLVAKADLINYRRRKDEEVTRLLKFCNEDLIKQMLPVLDNFERAIKLDDNNLEDEVSKFLEGFKMIYCSMQNIMGNFEVKPIDGANKPFDPVYHNAIMMEKVEGVESGVVVEVLQKGYIYKDKVIRPAMVKVSE